MSRTLHVLQGDSAAGCFRQALHPERGCLLVNQDVLSCGPLHAFESAQQWSRLRGEYWDSVAWDGQPASTFNGDFLHRISSIDDSDSLVFWMGSGVAEQLMLMWSMHLIRLVRSRAKVSVVLELGSRHYNYSLCDSTRRKRSGPKSNSAEFSSVQP